jgi:hypothetical protein
MIRAECGDGVRIEINATENAKSGLLESMTHAAGPTEQVNERRLIHANPLLSQFKNIPYWDIRQGLTGVSTVV